MKKKDSLSDHIALQNSQLHKIKVKISGLCTNKNQIPNCQPFHTSHLNIRYMLEPENIMIWF